MIFININHLEVIRSLVNSRLMPAFAGRYALDMNRSLVDVHTESDANPLADAAVARAAADVVRKASAVGLVDESPDFADTNGPALRTRRPIVGFERFDKPPSLGALRRSLVQ